jgi:hypothetical protein
VRLILARAFVSETLNFVESFALKNARKPGGWRGSCWRLPDARSPRTADGAAAARPCGPVSQCTDPPNACGAWYCKLFTNICTNEHRPWGRCRIAACRWWLVVSGPTCPAPSRQAPAVPPRTSSAARFVGRYNGGGGAASSRTRGRSVTHQCAWSIEKLLRSGAAGRQSLDQARAAQGGPASVKERGRHTMWMKTEGKYKLRRRRWGQETLPGRKQRNGPRERRESTARPKQRARRAAAGR